MNFKERLLDNWQMAETIGKGRVSGSHQDQHLRRKKIKSLIVAAAALLLWYVYQWLYLWLPQDVTSCAGYWMGNVITGPYQENAVEDMFYNFNDIRPSEKLQWHPCFNTAKCARLTVPLDYNRPLNVSKDNPKVHIAISMIPGAGHTETGKYSASPLLINPGGPGGSGAMFAVGVGAKIQSVVSTDRSRDVVGFDPRGVGATTPPADCWSYPSDGNETTSEDVKTGAFHQMTWALLGIEIPLVNATESALALRDRRARAVSELCRHHDDMDGEDSILRHVSTPAVAQDMSSIIDAWDEWRAETGQDVDEVDGQTYDDKTPDKNAYSLDTKGKLVYWGFSYGTLLGATFAAMFPKRVGRVVLDGVVDADYYVSPIWAESLRDADRVEEKFYHYCRRAGPLCAIYRDGDTQDSIRARVQGVFLALNKDPLSGVSPYSNLPFTFTHDKLKSLIFSGLYNPIFAFPPIASILSALYERDEQQILRMLPVFYPSYKPFCSTLEPAYLFPGQDAQLAIMCTDKRYPLNETLSNLEKRFEALAHISHFADIWMSLMLGCNAYDITPTDPPMRWDDHPAHKQTPLNTSFPLLFLSNTADPVTPLFAGVKMARKFVNAGFVEQRSEGHCSLAAVSRCTLTAVREYFEEGRVPERPRWGTDGQEVEKGIWRRCEADEWPWKQFDREAWMVEIEAKLREGTPGRDVDFQASMEEEARSGRRMEDWRDVQEFSKTFFRPRGMIGELNPSIW